MSGENEIDKMLSNLDEIKNGQDPRENESSAAKSNTTDKVEGIDSNDALKVVESEVKRLYEEHRQLRENLPIDQLHCGIARWDGRNGVCQYNKQFGGKRRFNKRITQTKYATGHHIVVINEKILEQGNRDEFLDTVRHEVAHALAYAIHGTSQKHNSNWKALARKLGADASSSHHKRDRSNEYRYFIRCPNCGTEGGKTKRSKVIKKPFTRKCGSCGHHPMSSYEKGQEPPEKGGIVKVESIPWDNSTEYHNQ